MNSRLFLGIGFCLSFLVVISAFNYKILDTGQPVSLTGGNDIVSPLPDIQATVYEKPPTPKVRFPIINVVPDDLPADDKPLEIDVSNPEGFVPDYPAGGIDIQEPPEEPVDKPVFAPETPAEPEGGLSAFYEFIGKNLKYPRLARQLDIEGKVTLTFIIERDGSLSDIEVIKGIGGGCDEEAVRVLAMSPKWNPGKQRGVPVRVRMTLPVVFKLRLW